MIYTRNGSDALASRFTLISPGTGIEHWGCEVLGPRVSRSHAPGPQATWSDMTANETIIPHFHGTTQYQLFPAGSGTIGRKADPIVPLTVQFKDHHTAYGPVVAGPNGLTFMALRINTGDSAPVYLDKPGYKDKLKPSKRRNWLSKPVSLSTLPVLEHRKEASWEPLFDQAMIDDEMNAHVLRLGANMAVQGPDPRDCGGYYLFVANGSMSGRDGEDLPLWSMVAVENNEDEFEIRAGGKGAEVLVLQFPFDIE